MQTRDTLINSGTTYKALWVLFLIMGNAVGTKSLFSRTAHASSGLGVQPTTHAASSQEGVAARASVKGKLSILSIQARTGWGTATRRTKKVIETEAAAGPSRRSFSSGTSSSSLVADATPSAEYTPSFAPTSAPSSSSTEEAMLFFDEKGGGAMKRRLLPEDAMLQEAGDRVCVVVGPASGKNYAEYVKVAESMGKTDSGMSRAFNRGAKEPRLQFMGTVGQIPSSTVDILSGGLTAAQTITALTTGGSGVAIQLDGDATGVEVKYSYVLNSSTELYDLNPRNRPPRDFLQLFSGNPGNNLPLVDLLISEVKYDSVASQSLALAYYTFDTNRGTQSNKPASPVQFTAAATGEKPDEQDPYHEKELMLEMEVGGLQFATELDKAINVEYANHFNFTPTEKPVFDMPLWVTRMKELMPRHWANTRSAVPKSAARPSQSHRIVQKDVVRFLDVVILIRQSNRGLFIPFIHRSGHRTYRWRSWNSDLAPSVQPADGRGVLI